MVELDKRRRDLRDHLLEHAVRTGDFTLKSGRKSSWFIDGKQTACDPIGIRLIADLVLEELKDIDAIGVAGIGADRGIPIRSFSVRKESKDHGVEGRIAGALRKGDRVAITEDVVTRGVSPLQAAEAVRAFGADPVMIIAVVDRGGTCRALAAEEGLKFFPLLTANDLGFNFEGP